MNLKLLYQTIRGRLSQTDGLSWKEGLATIAILSLAAMGVVWAGKQVGLLEMMELVAYDRMVQLRGDRALDDRLLIVGITEQDLVALNGIPSDQALAEAIAVLQQHRPRVIGLDLHRNLPHPPGWDALLAEMQADNVVVITHLGTSPADVVPPPPGIPPERVGFNDFPIDLDGVIRRNLLVGSNQEGVYFSFALRLATLYLAQEGIQLRGSDADPQVMQLGDTIFPRLTAQSGGYHRLDSNGYQVMMDYRRAGTIAPHLSLREVLDQSFDPALVQDRIVLIGSTAPSLKDLFPTPYSSGLQQDFQMAGVEIHGQLVSHILDAAQGNRPLIWFWPPELEPLWDLGWAVVGGALAWFMRRPLVASGGALLLLGGLGTTGYLCFLNYGWIPVVSPAVALGTSAGLMIAYRAQQAHQQQQMVMTLLGQNTSPEIANALWAGRDRLLKAGKLPGQRLTATILFVDVQGFSTLAEKLSPEDLLDWLNEYLETMVEVVKVHGGIVNKFTGDGLLAVFGLPVPRTTASEIAQDAQQAVKCALAFGQHLEQLNQRWERQGLATATMRVGIFTGPVVAGSLGGKDRLEYGVIGDSVNTASRLESCLKHRQSGICRVLIAQATLDYLGANFEVEAWGNLRLKGKSNGVEVYRVLAYRSSPLSNSTALTNGLSADNLPASLPPS